MLVDKYLSKSSRCSGTCFCSTKSCGHCILAVHFVTLSKSWNALSVLLWLDLIRLHDIHFVRLACQPISQQYFSLLTNQHQSQPSDIENYVHDFTVNILRQCNTSALDMFLPIMYGYPYLVELDWQTLMAPEQHEDRYFGDQKSVAQTQHTGYPGGAYGRFNDRQLSCHSRSKKCTQLFEVWTKRLSCLGYPTIRYKNIYM